MVPIVQVSRDNASILLCEYYHCISVDRLPWSVLFARARVYKRSHEFIAWQPVLSMLGVSLRVAWGSYTGTHTLSTWILHLTPCVACGKPLRLWLTTVCRLCQPVSACEYYRLTPWAPCVRLRWALILTRGGLLSCVYYWCCHSGSQEGNFRLYLGKINIIYALANHLFYLVFYPGAGLRCKLVQKRLDFWVKVW